MFNVIGRCQRPSWRPLFWGSQRACAGNSMQARGRLTPENRESRNGILQAGKEQSSTGEGPADQTGMIAVRRANPYISLSSLVEPVDD